MNFPKPTPLEAPLRSLEQVDLHRHVRCPRYDSCLGLSMALGWLSFSCAACPLAGRKPPDDELCEQALRRDANR